MRVDATGEPAEIFLRSLELRFGLIERCLRSLAGGFARPAEGDPERVELTINPAVGRAGNPA